MGVTAGLSPSVSLLQQEEMQLSEMCNITLLSLSFVSHALSRFLTKEDLRKLEFGNNISHSDSSEMQLGLNYFSNPTNKNTRTQVNSDKHQRYAF